MREYKLFYYIVYKKQAFVFGKLNLMASTRYILPLFFSFLLWHCSGPSADQAISSGPPPETTLRQYQSFVDKNQFERAKELSTKAEGARLDQLAASLADDTHGASVLNTQFLKTDCQVKGRTAYCLCQLQDEYESYEALFKLVISNGAWLVDTPEGNPAREEQIINEILQDYQEINN